MSGDEAEAVGLPCIVGKCAAECTGPQPDPWDKALMWSECPGKAAFKRADIDAALTVKGLAAMSPLSNWPRGYASHVVETWAAIESERNALRAARDG